MIINALVLFAKTVTYFFAIVCQVKDDWESNVVYPLNNV